MRMPFTNERTFVSALEVIQAFMDVHMLNSTGDCGDPYGKPGHTYVGSEDHTPNLIVTIHSSNFPPI